MHDDLIDRIYEAAFVPERWPDVLESMSSLSGSVGGVVFAVAPRFVSRWIASSQVRDVFTLFVNDVSAPPSRALAAPYAGFRRDVDILPAGGLERDPLHGWLKSKGLGWETGTVVPMPSGETVIFSLERRYAEGPHQADTLPILDALRPHLARAALIAARLGLERARTTVATLDALGLPAAVLASSGRVLAVNTLLEGSHAFRTGAQGRLVLAHAGADRLYRECLARHDSATGSWSIPIPGSQERPSSIVHLIPLRRAAHELFEGAILMVLTAVSMDANIPDLTLLRGLFDLSPKEARLAAALAGGRSLKQAAQDEGLRFTTARSYLEQVFRKTGTNQQSQLVALLKGAQPLAASHDGSPRPARSALPGDLAS